MRPWLIALPLALLLAGCPAEETKSTASPDAVASVGTAVVSGTAAPAAGGAAIFSARCAPCHGAAGAGGMGPTLKGIAKKGDTYIHTTIFGGHADKGMPAFEGQLSEADITAVMGYIKAL